MSGDCGWSQRRLPPERTLRWGNQNYNPYWWQIKRKELVAVKLLTNCSAVDPRRHALHEALADLRQRLARIELGRQTDAAEAAEGVDVALRAEILKRLNAGDQTHLRSTKRRY